MVVSSMLSPRPSDPTMMNRHNTGVLEPGTKAYQGCRSGFLKIWILGLKKTTNLKKSEF